MFALSSDHIVWLWVLLFGLQFFSQGISGLLPKFVSDHLPVNVRASGLGFCYNVGALGGAIAPIMGASVAASLGLGTALTVLTLGFTVLVAILVGFDVPGAARARSAPMVTTADRRRSHDDRRRRLAARADSAAHHAADPGRRGRRPRRWNGCARSCITAGVDGLFVGGSSGEAALLSDSQRTPAIEVAVERCRGTGARRRRRDRHRHRQGHRPRQGGGQARRGGGRVDRARSTSRRIPTRSCATSSCSHDAVDVPVIAYDIPSATHTRLPRVAVEALGGTREPLPV